MAENKKTKAEHDPTSPEGIAKDALASLILVSGALCVEWLKRFFPDGAPTLLLVMLNISEITLLLGFIIALIRMFRKLYSELNSLLRLVSKRGFLHGITQYYQKDKVQPSTWEIIKECASAGIVFVAIAGIFSLLIIAFSSLSTVWLVLLAVIAIGLVLFSFSEGGMLGAMFSTVSFAVVALISISVLVIFIIAFVLIFRWTGNSDLLQSAINFIFLRK